jgi:hypothetical protein
VNDVKGNEETVLNEAPNQREIKRVSHCTFETLSNLLKKSPARKFPRFIGMLNNWKPHGLSQKDGS